MKIVYAARNPKVRHGLSTGFDTEEEAREHAEFLSGTYGGVTKVNDNQGNTLAKYSVARGWR